MEKQSETKECVSDWIRREKEDHQCIEHYHWSPPDYKKAREFFEWLRELELEHEKRRIRL